MLDIEMGEDIQATGGENRRVEQIGPADPVIQSLETVPHADEDDLLASIGMCLAPYLRVYESFLFPGVAKCLLSLIPEDGDLGGIHVALEDPDYQTPTPTTWVNPRMPFSGLATASAITRP